MSNRPIQSRRSPRTAANNGLDRPGFTLVELLVTAAALTVVLALVTSSAQYIRGQGLLRFTRDLQGRIETALADYRQAHGGYPPDRFRPESVVPGPGHLPQTEGVECLVRALSLANQPVWAQPPYQRALANVDQDVNRIDGQPLAELVDGWGRPLLYYNGYGSAGARASASAPDGAPGTLPGEPLPPFAGVGKVGMRKLNDSLRDRWMHNEYRPVVDSAGPDGVFNNSDDPQRIQGGEE